MIRKGECNDGLFRNAPVLDQMRDSARQGIGLSTSRTSENEQVAGVVLDGLLLSGGWLDHENLWPHSLTHARQQRIHEFHRHRISYLNSNLTGTSFKLIRMRERLEKCGFSEGNCAIVCRMCKSPFGHVRATGGERRSYIVPFHSSVHVGMALVACMTAKSQSPREG